MLDILHCRGESESIKVGAVKCVGVRKAIPANFEKWGKYAHPVIFFHRSTFCNFFYKKNTSKPITAFSAISEMNEDLMLQINIKTYIMGERFGS